MALELLNQKSAGPLLDEQKARSFGIRSSLETILPPN